MSSPGQSHPRRTHSQSNMPNNAPYHRGARKRSVGQAFPLRQGSKRTAKESVNSTRAAKQLEDSSVEKPLQSSPFEASIKPSEIPSSSPESPSTRPPSRASITAIMKALAPTPSGGSPIMKASALIHHGTQLFREMTARLSPSPPVGLALHIQHSNTATPESHPVISQPTHQIGHGDDHRRSVSPSLLEERRPLSPSYPRPDGPPPHPFRYASPPGPPPGHFRRHSPRPPQVGPAIAEVLEIAAPKPRAPVEVDSGTITPTDLELDREKFDGSPMSVATPTPEAMEQHRRSPHTPVDSEAVEQQYQPPPFPPPHTVTQREMAAPESAIRSTQETMPRKYSPPPYPPHTVDKTHDVAHNPEASVYPAPPGPPPHLVGSPNGHQEPPKTYPPPPCPPPHLINGEVLETPKNFPPPPGPPPAHLKGELDMKSSVPNIRHDAGDGSPQKIYSPPPGPPPRLAPPEFTAPPLSLVAESTAVLPGSFPPPPGPPPTHTHKAVPQQYPPPPIPPPHIANHKAAEEDGPPQRVYNPPRGPPPPSASNHAAFENQPSTSELSSRTYPPPPGPPPIQLANHASLERAPSDAKDVGATQPVYPPPPFPPPDHGSSSAEPNLRFSPPSFPPADYSRATSSVARVNTEERPTVPDRDLTNGIPVTEAEAKGEASSDDDERPARVAERERARPMNVLLTEQRARLRIKEAFSETLTDIRNLGSKVTLEFPKKAPTRGEILTLASAAMLQLSAKNTNLEDKVRRLEEENERLRKEIGSLRISGTTPEVSQVDVGLVVS